MPSYITCQYKFNGYIMGTEFSPLSVTETKPERRQPPFFELIGGNVCLDFINTLDDRPSGQPKELLKNYYDLARFGEDAGILTPEQLDYFFERVHLLPDEAEDALRRALNLREAMHAVFSALMNRRSAPPVAFDTLNACIQDAALHSRLVQIDGRCEWRFDDLTSSFDAIWWPIARAAADLLASSDLAMVRACSSPTCQWFFLDTSKNHHRRWCSMKQCGNREKVRRFYARRRA
jgi:predicted RNA-binding Zn ribbon-like protein